MAACSLAGAAGGQLAVRRKSGSSPNRRAARELERFCPKSAGQSQPRRALQPRVHAPSSLSQAHGGHARQRRLDAGLSRCRKRAALRWETPLCISASLRWIFPSNPNRLDGCVCDARPCSLSPTELADLPPIYHRNISPQFFYPQHDGDWGFRTGNFHSPCRAGCTSLGHIPAGTCSTTALHRGPDSPPPWSGLGWVALSGTRPA